MPDVQVEGGVFETSREKLAHVMEALRVWVLNAPVHALLGFFVLVLGFSVSLGAFIRCQTGEAGMMSLHPAMGGGNHARQALPVHLVINGLSVGLLV